MAPAARARAHPSLAGNVPLPNGRSCRRADGVPRGLWESTKTQVGGRAAALSRILCTDAIRSPRLTALAKISRRPTVAPNLLNASAAVAPAAGPPRICASVEGGQSRNTPFHRPLLPPLFPLPPHRLWRWRRRRACRALCPQLRHPTPSTAVAVQQPRHLPAALLVGGARLSTTLCSSTRRRLFGQRIGGK